VVRLPTTLELTENNLLLRIYRHLIEPKLHLRAASSAAKRSGFTCFPVLGSNMAPTLEIGEIAWVRIARSQAFERGQVIAVRLPEHDGKVVPFRVVGLPGETVELREGDLLVDGVRMPQPYVVAERAQQAFSLNLDPTEVPAASLYLMGDYRDMSKDSRHIGSVPVSAVVGAVAKAHRSGDHRNARIVQ
jgi:signal peptidase I